MREKDDLDLLLDSALSTYADPGPDAGLEDRVLSALESARFHELPAMRMSPKPRRHWLAWAFALPVAVCLLLLWLFTAKTIHAPSTPTQQAQQTNHTPGIAPAIAHEVSTRPSSQYAARTAVSARPPSNAQVANAVPLPKLDVFPTPQPMSAEERALSAVAAQTPLPLRKALAEAQQDDAPIHIASTHIPPLESLDERQP